MTETTTRIHLGELTLARVTCLKCNATVEIPLERLERAVDGKQCPCCKEEVIGDDETQRLAELRKAIKSAQKLELLSIEFALQETSG